MAAWKRRPPPSTVVSSQRSPGRGASRPPRAAPAASPGRRRPGGSTVALGQRVGGGAGVDVDRRAACANTGRVLGARRRSAAPRPARARADLPQPGARWAGADQHVAPRLPSSLDVDQRVEAARPATPRARALPSGRAQLQRRARAAALAGPQEAAAVGQPARQVVVQLHPGVVLLHAAAGGWRRCAGRPPAAPARAGRGSAPAGSAAPSSPSTSRGPGRGSARRPSAPRPCAPPRGGDDAQPHLGVGLAGARVGEARWPAAPGGRGRRW